MRRARYLPKCPPCRVGFTVHQRARKTRARSAATGVSGSCAVLPFMRLCSLHPRGSLVFGATSGVCAVAGKLQSMGISMALVSS